MNETRRDNTALDSAPRWTIDDLGAQVALALSRDYEGQSNGQISDVPNRRTIRYYTSLGLLDRPAAMRGRTALYDERHLLQLVAIKRLQTEGLSLAEIQERLATVSDSTLSRLANLPPVVHAEGAEVDDRPPEAAESSRTRDFWQSGPAPLTEEELAADQAGPGPGGSGPAEEQAAERVGALTSPTRSAFSLQGLELADGVVLLVESSRSLSGLDVDAIETAAAPLLAVLRARGLSPASPAATAQRPHHRNGDDP